MAVASPGRRRGGLLAAMLCIAVSGGASGRSVADDPAARQIDALAMRVDRFVLANGLRVAVHTDRKAPVVTVSVRYGVGAKYERPDRSGFAHLFEHLMFSGSKNAPGDYVARIREAGGTEVNGNTGYDDTAFYETVPVAALERVLFLEADRMGHLADAIDQATLDTNRRIVKNEKRQSEDQPGGTANERAVSRLFRPGDPHGHTVYGSMATLDAADVADVREWHRRHYTPNNAVLVLAGDVDVATARRLVERHFGNLPRGPIVQVPPAPAVSLPAPVTDVVTDYVPATSVTRHWVVPGLDRPDGVELDMAAKVLGTLGGAWLEEALVQREGLVSSLVVSSGASADVGTFIVSYTVADGADPATVASRLDELLADFLRTGPSIEEIRRVAMREIGWQTLSLETSAGQAATLSEGLLSADDPLFFRRRLRTAASLTPVAVRAAAARWLTRPSYTMTILPGAPASRSEPPTTDTSAAPAAERPFATANALPALGATAPLRFAAVGRMRLTNGIEVVHVRRKGVPVTRMALVREGGRSADVARPPGTLELLLATLPEGTTTRDGRAMKVAHDMLGIDWLFEAGGDRTSATLTVPTGALDRATMLFAEVLRRPRLADDAVIRQRELAIQRARQQQAMPGRVAGEVMDRLLYGGGIAGARDLPATDALSTVSRADLMAVHRAWIRPDGAKLFVVSDVSTGRLRAVLKRAFGDWRGIGPAGRVATPRATPPAPGVVLVDRPGVGQSVIVAAVPTFLPPQTDMLALQVGNEALGGPRGRINVDLRERNGWSYGAAGWFRQTSHDIVYMVRAPVQADRTGAAVEVIRRHLADMSGERSMTTAEFGDAVRRLQVNLPARFERGDALLAVLRDNDASGRPDDYQATLRERYRRLTCESVATEWRRAVDPGRAIWVIVGNARNVRPQLDALGLPVTLMADR